MKAILARVRTPLRFALAVSMGFVVGNFGIALAATTFSTTAITTDAFTVGSTSTLQVNTSGNLTKVNNVSYNWPSSQGASTQVLTNDGAGNLTWAAASGGSGGGWTDDGTTVRLTTATDNVGIGSATANFKLDVTQPASAVAGFGVKGGTGAFTPSSSTLSDYGGLVVHARHEGGQVDMVSLVSTGTDSGNYHSAMSFYTRSSGAGLDPVERMRIDADGNVGIGVTPSLGRLHVIGGDSYFGSTSIPVKWGNTSGTISGELNYASGKTRVIATSGNELGLSAGGGLDHMLISTGGRVMIGATAAIQSELKLGVQGGGVNTNVATFYNSDGTAPEGIAIKLGVATPGTGDGFVNFYNSSGFMTRITGDGAGGIVYNTASDVRLKENVVETRYSIDDLMKIHVRDYNFISAPGKTTTGVIAQELAAIYPSAVTVGGTDAKTNPWGVDYGRLTPLLVKSVQDLKSENDMLKSELCRRDATYSWCN